MEQNDSFVQGANHWFSHGAKVDDIAPRHFPDTQTKANFENVILKLVLSIIVLGTLSTDHNTKHSLINLLFMYS